MTNRLLMVALVTVLITHSPSIAHVQSADLRSVDTVSTATIREVTAALTVADMEGRGTGQPGGARAAEYLARRFAQAGAEPLGPGGFLQTVPLAWRSIDTSSMVVLGNTPIRFAADYLMFPPLRVAYPPIDGLVTFAGWGVTNQAIGRDDLEGLNLRGRVVFLLSGGRRRGVDQRLWDGAVEREVVLRRLAERGVIAAITVPGAGNFEQAANFLGRPALVLAEPLAADVTIPLFVVSPRVAEQLFAGQGTSLNEVTAQALSGVSVSRNLTTRFRARLTTSSVAVTGHNVVAAVRGTDARLANEAVVYSAHYDAFGRDPAGTIRPGAADNALGVAKLVALAEAFAAQSARPRRTIIFFAPTGEEYGNLGTEYWLDHPTWPLKDIAANINFDGIGTEVFGPVKRVIDYGITYSDVGATVRAVLAGRGMVLVPDGAPEQGFFQRSDHYAFTKRGIPPVYLIGSAGTESASSRAGRFFAEAYHTPADTIHDDWWWEGARDLSMVGFLVGQRLGNAPSMPAWLENSPYRLERGSRLGSQD